MAASAYMQARNDPGRAHEAKKSALYTGIAYAAVVFLLVLPHALFEDASVSLVTMSATIVLVILLISYYTSVLFERNFKRQVAEMLFFSVGVAAIALILGSAFRRITGITL
jgi:VIT1/CCC1 family predicted Fe2+/Mn2+ transporter